MRPQSAGANHVTVSGGGAGVAGLRAGQCPEFATPDSGNVVMPPGGAAPSLPGAGLVQLLSAAADRTTLCGDGAGAKGVRADQRPHLAPPDSGHTLLPPGGVRLDPSYAGYSPF